MPLCYTILNTEKESNTLYHVKTLLNHIVSVHIGPGDDVIADQQVSSQSFFLKEASSHEMPSVDVYSSMSEEGYIIIHSLAAKVLRTFK